MFPRNIRKFSEQLFQWITKKLTFTSKKKVYLKWQKPWLSVTIVTLVFFSALFLTHLNFQCILFSFRNIFSSFLSPYKFLKTELSCRNLKLYLFSGLERIIWEYDADFYSAQNLLTRKEIRRWGRIINVHISISFSLFRNLWLNVLCQQL
jgi:hypothetical protein